LSDVLNLDWHPPGPICASFVDDWSPLSAIMGPVGSGKTTGCLVKIVKAAQLQRPSPRDGIRRYKHLVIRDTFTNLQRTILPSWFNIFPKDAGEWVGGPPATHRLQFSDRWGPIHLQVDFMGLGDDAVENLLRGYEGTGFYGNEVDLMGYGVVDFLQSRMGRYPSKMDGGPTWFGGWLDFNAPEQDHWLHQLLVDGEIPESDPVRPATGISFFVQPGGLDAGAENRHNLPPRYYETMMRTMPDWRARRLVHNRWGYSRDGKPVHPEFNDTLHVAATRLEPVRGVKLRVAMDAGGTPAAVIGQELAGGRTRLIAEVVSGPGTGPRRFGEMLLEGLQERCRHHDVREVEGVCDPSAEYGGNDEGADPHWMRAVQDVVKFRIRPAPTNKPLARQQALKTKLTRMVEGQPSFLMCPSMKNLRKALNSGYHFRKIQLLGASGRFDTKPAKNPFSHIAEAAEYFELGGTGGLVAALGMERGSGRMQVIGADYDIFGDDA
jgi:hypothetical protein